MIELMASFICLFTDSLLNHDKNRNALNLKCLFFTFFLLLQVYPQVTVEGGRLTRHSHPTLQVSFLLSVSALCMLLLF